MKPIYELRGYKVYKTKIAGYNCELHQTKSGYFSVGVPEGDTPEDKKMFDKLVYFNQRVYHADSAKQVKKQVAEFIKKYKKNNK